MDIEVLERIRYKYGLTCKTMAMLLDVSLSNYMRAVKSGRKIDKLDLLTDEYVEDLVKKTFKAKTSNITYILRFSTIVHDFDTGDRVQLMAGMKTKGVEFRSKQAIFPYLGRKAVMNEDKFNKRFKKV